MRSTAPFGVAIVIVARSVMAQDAGEPISLAPEQAAAFALSVAEAASESPTVVAHGIVLDPLPFVEAALARDAARGASAIAEREESRVGRLARADHNASGREVEAARLATLRAHAELGVAEARVAGTWGRASSAVSDDGFRTRLARGEASIAQLMLPPDGGGVPRDVAVGAPAIGAAQQRARILGPAASVPSGLQGRTWLVALESPSLAAGTAVEARVGLDGAAIEGVRIPATAVVWSEGASFVFVAEGDHRFRRRAVELAASREQASWITHGLRPGERFVRTGAQQLLSAELGVHAAEE